MASVLCPVWRISPVATVTRECTKTFARSCGPAAKFDAKAAFEKFEKEWEGLLYGFPTMLWGWLDMPNNDNLPPPLDIELVACLLAIGMGASLFALVCCAPPLLPACWTSSSHSRASPLLPTL